MAASRKIGRDNEEIQTSTYKVNKSSGCGVQHREYRANNNVKTLYDDTW